MDRRAFLEALVGRPYRIGARGPQEFDCYGLAAYVQRELAQIEMPEVDFDEPTTRAQAEAMLKHPERESWTEIQEADVGDLDLVLMGNVAKRDFHLGTFVKLTTVGAILHTDRIAGVVVDDLPALRAVGFNHLKFYRRKS